MQKKVSIFLIFVSIMLLGASCKKATEEKIAIGSEKKVGGSCNRIEVEGEGYCTDYIGEEAYSSAPCASKYYSKDACPPSTIGGCKFKAGSSKESIQWAYDYGGYAVDQDQVEAVLKPSCLLKSGAQWTN